VSQIKRNLHRTVTMKEHPHDTLTQEGHIGMMTNLNELFHLI